ncbi:CDC48 family AAA ATPase [Nanoarchaeota archaeon]
MTKEISLKVAEAIQDDVNKGIVRIDTSIMQNIDVRPGDIVEITGERPTVAMVDRAYPGDIGLNIIRMDGVIRRNAKTGIGEIVKIKRAEVKEAKKITIAPAKKGVFIKAPPSLFKQGLLGRALIKGDIVSLGGSKRRRTTTSGNPFFDDVFNMLDDNIMNFGFGEMKFIVVDAEPKQSVIVTEVTEVIFKPEATEVKEESALPDVSYEDIGGLDEEIKKVREMVELPLKHPEIFERLGIDAPKGVLLHGPPGTGKTLLAKAVATETNSNFVVINGPEIMSKYYGQSEENLRKIFEDAEKNAPSIIFIDEIDAIAIKREEVKGEVERRVVAQLLALMDGLKSRGKVVVIAASNVPNLLDPALRRPGRFDREIDIGVPRTEGRLKILKIHTRNMPINRDPSSIDPRLKEDEIKKQISDLLQQVDSTKLIELVLKKHKPQDNHLEGTQKEITTYLEALLPKGVNSSKQDFLSKCIEKISEDITNTIRSNSIIKEEGQVELNGGELNYPVKDKLKELVDEKNISDKISTIVKEIILKEISEVTYGFVGADLSSLAKEAAMIVLRRVLPELKLESEESISREMLEKLTIAKKDFFDALKVVRPSAMREVLVEIPKLSWDDVGGLEDAKQNLKEAVEWPLKNPEAFSRLGVKPPKGILLYGPPGTGKTLLAKAVANESQANFILVKGPEMLSKWVGESEKAVRKIFEKARQVSPSIVFFDEIDSIAPRRGATSDSKVTERVVNQMLTEIDGLEEMQDVVVIAATNRPDIIDTALLRPGRFDRLIPIGIPDEKTRKEVFNVHIGEMPIKDVSVDELAKKTEGYVGADIEAVCREAAINALRKDMSAKQVTMGDFESALKEVGPSVTKDIEDAYKNLKNTMKSARGEEFKKEKPLYFG